MTIKATKTSLYKLVTEYAAPPIMKKTEFIKAHRSPSYWLEWYESGTYYKAYFSVCAGAVLLAITSKEYDEDTGRYKTVRRDTHKLNAEDLRGRGMINEQERGKAWQK